MMQRNTGYQIVASEEPVVTEPPALVADSAEETRPDELPSYEEANQREPEGGASDGNAPCAGSDVLAGPPSYNVATTLPTYEEAELSKQQEEAEATEQNHNQIVREADLGDVQLGTDSVFLCTFIMSFLFNWVGLMASLCFCQSIAGRMGALAGFGLSLVKWVAIAKHNHLIHEVAANDSWIWWLLITMGLLIFLKGCVQYIRIKHQWGGGSQFRSRVIMTL